MKKLNTFIISLALSCMMGQLFAQAPRWQIVKEDSTIRFTGTQNNAPISGEFKSFDGNINFDSNNLKESKVNLKIDMNSVSAGFVELSSMLKTLDWFDSAKFPQASFESKEIIKDGNHYQIKGDLKVRDKQSPIVVNAVLDENTANKLKIHGTTIISRTQLGVGQGEWANTAEIKDEVKVNFNLELKR